jgi:hypothetical protein
MTTGVIIRPPIIATDTTCYCIGCERRQREIDALQVKKLELEKVIDTLRDKLNN